MKPRYQATLLAPSCLALLLAATAVAQPRHEEGPREGRGIHPVHPFTGQDRDHWRGGGWQHGYHDGRMGWWWVVGPEWYFYPAPLYPYPNPYVPPAIAAPRANMWYWCAAPAGYYPYVAQCSMPWEAVGPRPPG
jgi:hypothetical protein